MNAPSKPTSATNELAKERNRAAAERTLMAWIQNSLTLMGLGIAFDEILKALQRRFPQEAPENLLKYSHIVGLGLIAVAIALLVPAIIQYRIIVRSIERDDYLSTSSRPLNFAIAGAVFLFCFAAAIAVFI